MSDDQAGWGNVLRKVLTQLHAPWKSLSWSRSVTSAEGSPLLTIRLVFVSFLTALAGFGVVLLFVLHDTSPRSATPFLALVAIQGVVSIAGVLWARGRRLRSDNPTFLLQSFMTNFFLGLAFADLPALLGFVGAFITGRLGPFLLGLSFAVVGFALTAPTEGAIRRRDEQLAAAGSPHLLSDALRRPPTTSTPTG